VVKSSALLVIDHERLQAEAWEQVRSARKRMERAAAALHRHEEVDEPAYNRWLYRTFPALLTQKRELQEQMAATARKIQAVERQAFYHGGSAKRIWREHREREAHPERYRERQEDAEPEEEPTGRRQHATPEDFVNRTGPTPSVDARAIYRRLVQRLHPDRGGEWTAVRERLWHDVQQAWAAGDVDWLARLEVDWETAHDALGARSPLSRLRRAIEELDAARRDIERKLGEYRHEPAWQFTRAEDDRTSLERRVRRRMIHDLKALRDQLGHLQRTIALWEDDWTRPTRRGQSSRFRSTPPS
jgi:hypothetical protein